MKLPRWLNSLLTVRYLRRQRVEWSGKLPHINMLRRPVFLVFGTLRLGSGVKFLTDKGIRTTIQVDTGATITVGNNVVFYDVLWIRAVEKITIGNDVKIGMEVTIRDAGLHPSYPGHRVKVAPVHLERNCAIGTRSCIGPGVSIGENTIVGELSLVLHSLPANVAAGGNPAQVLKDYKEKFVGHEKWVRP